MCSQLQVKKQASGNAYWTMSSELAGTVPPGSLLILSKAGPGNKTGPNSRFQNLT